MTIIQIVLLFALINSVLSLFTKKSNNLFCGIIGFSGPSKSKFDLNKLKVLFYINSLERGRDSVGYFTPANGIKKIDKEYKYVVEAKDNIIDNITKDNVLIGHVRAKTSGVNNLKNAHPWEYKNIVGLHNGTLKNFSYTEGTLAKRYNLTISDWDVDSQVLIQALDQNFENFNGETLLPALEEYEGAAALLLYHKERGTIFACHDKERPLFYGYVGKSMYISSIEHILNIIGCTDVQAFDENFMHEIKEGQIINKFAYTPQGRLEKPKSNVSTSDFVAGIMSAKATTQAELDNYYKYDESLGRTVGKSNYPAKGLKFTGTHTFFNYDAKLWGDYIFRLRATESVEIVDQKTKEVITFDPNEDFFKIIQMDGGYNSYKTCIVEHIDTKEQYTIKAHHLESNNFIPVEGNFVRSLHNINYTTGDMDSFCRFDDILEFVHYSPVNGSYCLRNIKNFKTAMVHPNLFVKATLAEVTNYAYHFNWPIYTKILGFDENDSCDVDYAVEDKPEVIKLNDPTEIIHDEEDTLFDSSTAIIDCDKLDNFVTDIKESIDEIDSLVQDKKNLEEVKENVGQLKLFLNEYNFNNIIIN